MRDSKINSVHEGWGDRRKEKRLWLRWGGHRCVGRVVALAYEVGGGVRDGSGGLLIGPVREPRRRRAPVTCRCWCERAGTHSSESWRSRLCSARGLWWVRLSVRPERGYHTTTEHQGRLPASASRWPAATLDARCPCDRMRPRPNGETPPPRPDPRSTPEELRSLRLRTGALPHGPPLSARPGAHREPGHAPSRKAALPDFFLFVRVSYMFANSSSDVVTGRAGAAGPNAAPRRFASK